MHKADKVNLRLSLACLYHARRRLIIIILQLHFLHNACIRYYGYNFKSKLSLLITAIYSLYRSCAIILPPSVAHQAQFGQGPMLLLPHVILFAPTLQFPFLFHDGFVCPDCGSNVHLLRWNDGSSAAHSPRILHDVNHMVFLVSAIYRCTLGHDFVGTDPWILQRFKEQEHMYTFYSAAQDRYDTDVCLHYHPVGVRRNDIQQY